MFPNRLRSDAEVDSAVYAKYITASNRLPVQASIFTTEFSAMKLALGCKESRLSDCKYKFFVLRSVVCDVTADHPTVCKIFEWLAFHGRRGWSVSFFWGAVHVGVEKKEEANKLVKLPLALLTFSVIL